jgi:hypothetical protein
MWQEPERCGKSSGDVARALRDVARALGDIAIALTFRSGKGIIPTPPKGFSPLTSSGPIESKN